jgi:antitoxin component of MazEF toxin-antitoxin module
MIEAARFKPGDELELRLRDRTILVQPAPGKPTLAQLLDAITPENCHPPTDWGRPAGKEAW